MIMLSQDAYPLERSKVPPSSRATTRLSMIVCQREPHQAVQLDQEQRISYQQDGFLLMPDLFNKEEVAFLFDAMQQHARRIYAYRTTGSDRRAG
jgi:ectoine hydroxylase